LHKRIGDGENGFLKFTRFYETKHLLMRAYQRKLLTETQVGHLKPLLDELAPTLNAYLRSIGKIPQKTGNEQMTTDHGQK